MKILLLIALSISFNYAKECSKTINFGDDLHSAIVCVDKIAYVFLKSGYGGGTSIKENPKTGKSHKCKCILRKEKSMFSKPIYEMKLIN